MPDKTDHHADVIARPPGIYLGFLLLGVVLDYFWPAPFLPAMFQYAAGGVLAVSGVALAAAAMGRFRAAGTSVPTTEPTNAIVTDGPYRYSRNPIYVALSLIYAGIGVAIDSAWVLALLAPLLIVMQYGVIRREERYLTEYFGDEYLRYKASVRRWI